MEQFEQMIILLGVSFILMAFVHGSAAIKKEEAHKKHLRSLKIGNSVLVSNNYFESEVGIIVSYVPYSVKSVSNGLLSSHAVYHPEGFNVNIQGTNYFFRPNEMVPLSTAV